MKCELASEQMLTHDIGNQAQVVKCQLSHLPNDIRNTNYVNVASVLNFAFSLTRQVWKYACSL